ncbi:MAG TPA: hypothetical protein VHB73_00465 [Alphaproteobacteria bacterium]|nr:hypothetical protein [Alphaproteobacteria bacterium]
MSIESKTKRAAGFVEEEAGEMLHNANMAQRGRNLRNEGRWQEGMMPKTSEPGKGKKED